MIVGSADEADARSKDNEAVVLARATTSPEDVHGLIAARAAVTEQGGTTSHAAVVARALGKPCVVGCGPGTVSPLIGRRVTVDGNTGIVYDGELPLQIQTETADPYLRQLLEWALERTSIRIELEAPPGVAPLEIAGSKQIGDASELSQSLAELPAGGCVCGTLFSQDDSAVQAAIAAGVTMIVTSPRLPALLVAHRLSPPGGQRSKPREHRG